MHGLADVWPLFRLRLVNGQTELRYPRDEDLAQLAELARTGVHDPETMPFLQPWTDAPPAEVAVATLQWNWKNRAEWNPESWSLNLIAVEAGLVVGNQSVSATKFGVTRTVETGSWVGRVHQGRGVGTRMRQAVLHLAFVGLDARQARSAGFVDNPSSLRVSEKLGYVTDGTDIVERRGEAATVIRLRLTREAWEASGPPPVAMSGVDECQKLFGVTPLSVRDG
jgi:RimJ/RimL family protein N-acetyltransferase